MKLNFKDKIYNFANISCNTIAAILLTLLAFASFCYTARFRDGWVETIDICRDSIVVNIIALNFIGLFIIFILRKIDVKYNLTSVDVNLLEKRVLLLIGIIAILWIVFVQSKPFADGKQLCDAVGAFAKGDFSLLEKSEYFGKFPFQLNLLLVFELVFWFAGKDNFLILQILNVVSLLISYHYILKIHNILFESKQGSIILMMLLATCFPPMLYCTFIYGTMYGLAFATTGVYFSLLYLKKWRINYLIYSVLFLTIASLIKSNYLIYFLAVAIMLIVKCIKTKRYISLLLIPLVVIMYLGTGAGVQKYYEVRSGVKIHSGIPSISWIAMGLERGNKGPGWYNGSMFENYEKANFDTDKTKNESKNYIKEILVQYLDNPVKLIEFIGEKAISQWCEPTYESLWVSEHPKNEDMHSITPSKVVNSLYYGKLNDIYIYYCDFYQLLVFFLAAVFFWSNRTRLDVSQLILIIIVIGGFLFHILWEANSKYILPYYLYIIPYAALGIDFVNSKFTVLIDKKRKKALR